MDKPLPFPPLMPGDWVVVWWHPETEDIREGAARLASRIEPADSDGWEVWWVVFTGQSDPVMRIVRPADKIIGQFNAAELARLSDLRDPSMIGADMACRDPKGGGN